HRNHVLPNGAIRKPPEWNTEHSKEDDKRHAAEERELQVSKRHLLLDQRQQNVNDRAVEIIEDVDEREQRERIPRIPTHAGLFSNECIRLHLRLSAFQNCRFTTNDNLITLVHANRLEFQDRLILANLSYCHARCDLVTGKHGRNEL